MKRHLLQLTCFLIGTLLVGGTAMGVAVNSTPRTLTQPDGSTFTAIKHGDEYLSWVARPDGRPIAQGHDGTWFYVSNYTNEKVLLSKRPAHRSPPKGKAPLPRLHPNLGPDGVDGTFDPVYIDIYEEAIAAADAFINFATFDVGPDDNPDGFIQSSELSIIIVLAGYENAYTVNTPSTHAHARNAGGVLLAINDPGPLGNVIHMDGTYAMVGELADDGRANSLGVLVHELGHLTFGLPDLYDGDYAANGDSGGVGQFGVMGQGSTEATRREIRSPVRPQHCLLPGVSSSSAGLKQDRTFT